MRASYAASRVYVGRASVARVLALLALSAAAACTSVPAERPAPVIEFVVGTDGDEIRFSRRDLRAPLGARVRLRFHNDASFESQISHSIALVRPGHEEPARRLIDRLGYDLGALSQLDASEHFIAASEMVLPGGEVAVEFAPDAPGRYVYICLMPGHGNVLGMQGVLTIEPSRSAAQRAD